MNEAPHALKVRSQADAPLFEGNDNPGTPGAIQSSPDVARSAIYVGSDDGKLYALKK